MYKEEESATMRKKLLIGLLLFGLSGSVLVVNALEKWRELWADSKWVDDTHYDLIVDVRDEEETDEKVNLADLKNSLKLSENTSLKFVLIIGVIILAAILLLPLTNKM